MGGARCIFERRRSSRYRGGDQLVSFYNVPVLVTIEATDEPGDSGDSLVFIDHLATDTAGTGCDSSFATTNSGGSGAHDRFVDVIPGASVCWKLVPAQNTTVAPTATPQVFQARLTALAKGSPVDTRVVYFIVPPTITIPVAAN